MSRFGARATMGSMATEVRNNESESRYEALVDGEYAGKAEYLVDGDTITFTHTEVDLEGQGVGSALAREALDDVRRQGDKKVVARCPFIKGWIDKHPDYADLLAA